MRAKRPVRAASPRSPSRCRYRTRALKTAQSCSAATTLGRVPTAWEAENANEFSLVEACESVGERGGSKSAAIRVERVGSATRSRLALRRRKKTGKRSGVCATRVNFAMTASETGQGCTHRADAFRHNAEQGDKVQLVLGVDSKRQACPDELCPA